MNATEYTIKQTKEINYLAGLSANCKLRMALKLKDVRKAKGITQDQLRAACGFASKAHVSDLESGKRNWTHAAALKAAKFLDSQ